MMRDSTTRRSLAPSILRSRESSSSHRSCTSMSVLSRGVGTLGATKMLVATASMLAAASATVDIAWTATQRDKGGALKLLEDQKPITFAPMPSKPAEKSLVVDWTKTCLLYTSPSPRD